MPLTTAVESFFPQAEGCFLLYDARNRKVVEVFNEQRCRRREPACSTFKVPLAVAAFDSGILPDENFVIEWDGQNRTIDSWNADHTAVTWMRDSVVWFSQALTPLIGRKRMTKYLEEFNYGNRDFSGGIRDSWLTRSTLGKSAPKATVRISAFEQIEFLEKLWDGTLPATPRSQELARKITYIETSPSGWTLHGKTGSGTIGENNDLRLGWFIARVARGEERYYAVVTFNDLKPNPSAPYGGIRARAILKELLASRGLF